MTPRGLDRMGDVVLSERQPWGSTAALKLGSLANGVRGRKRPCVSGRIWVLRGGRGHSAHPPPHRVQLATMTMPKGVAPVGSVVGDDATSVSEPPLTAKPPDAGRSP